MKIAIDIHGTIDARPKFFSKLTKLLKALCVEIHITTGIPDTLALRHMLDALEIRYDYVFSITNYHQSIGTTIRWDGKCNPWIDDLTWNRTKGDYCKRNNIDLAIDDSPDYGRYFVTPYLLFEKKKNGEGAWIRVLRILMQL